MSAIGGNAEKQPADPSYYLPKKSAKSFVQDNALYLAISVVGNFLLIFGILGISLILGVHYKRTPIIVTQNTGFCYKRTTSVYELSDRAIRTFLRFTIEGILNPYLTEQDPAIFLPFIANNVVEATTKHLEERNSKKRQYWELENFVDDKDARFLTIEDSHEVRRYDNPQLPQFMGFVVLGKRTVVEDFIALDGSKEKRVSSTPSLIIAYVTQERANAYNPWGLYLNGIQEKTNPEEIKEIWNQAQPLVGSEDLEGNLIMTAREEYMAPPLFERIRFYSWYSLYPPPPTYSQSEEEITEMVPTQATKEE